MTQKRKPRYYSIIETNHYEVLAIDIEHALERIKCMDSPRFLEKSDITVYDESGKLLHKEESPEYDKQLIIDLSQK